MKFNKLYLPSAQANGAINRYCLITGASSGIGLAIAEEFGKLGRNLVLVALPETGLEKIAHDLHHRFGISILTLCLDLTEENASQKIFDACEDHGLVINVLVNNAGFGNLEVFHDSRLPELQNMMALNNAALVSLTHQFIPHLKRSAPSHILNTGSLASFFQIPYKAVYSATKSFVYSFSASLRLELRPDKIYVSCLCPGGTLTSNRFQEILKKSAGNGSRFLQQPDEVAQTAVREMFRKKFRIVPGLHNKLMLFFYELLPERITHWILIAHFKPKKIGT
jgi:short-subunit dehydrogenase